MSIYSRYADTVREAQTQYAKLLDNTAQGAQQYVARTRQAVVKAEQLDGAFDYLERVITARNEAGKELAAASASFTTKVLAQLDASADAAREYASAAQSLVAEQVRRDYGDYLSAVERVSSAWSSGTYAAAKVADAPAPQPAEQSKKRGSADAAA